MTTMKTFIILLNTITAVVAFQQGITVPTFSSCRCYAPVAMCHPTKEVPTKKRTSVQIFSQSSTTGADEDKDEDKKLAKKIAGRKKRVVTGYKLTSVSYLLLGLTIIGKNRIPYYGMGPILVAGVGWILSDAATNNRLSSDTYKRLNLSLIASTSFSCTGNILMGGFAFERFMAFITIVNSIKGYGYGLKGWELKKACAKEDLLKGFKQSLQICSKVPNVKSAGYLAMSSVVGALIAFKFKDLACLILNSSKSFMIGTRMYRLSKLLLLGSISFTLKDAADRGRLDGTTFIHLNYLSSVTFAALTCKFVR